MYCQVPSKLRNDFEEIWRIAGFSSEADALKQAIREFIDVYTPRWYHDAMAEKAKMAVIKDLLDNNPEMAKFLHAPTVEAARQILRENE